MHEEQAPARPQHGERIGEKRAVDEAAQRGGGPGREEHDEERNARLTRMPGETGRAVSTSSRATMVT